MRLTQTYAHKHTALLLTVEYEPKTNEITETISVSAHDYNSNKWIDITEAAGMMVNLDKIIDEINWRMLYAEQRPDAIGRTWL